MEVDSLKLLRGRPIIINERLTLYQPTLGQIEENGEQQFMNTFWTLCSSAWDTPSFFADLGIDFMTISDWDYFSQIVCGYSHNDTALIFGDVDFSIMKPFMLENENEQEIVLANTQTMVYAGEEFPPETYIFNKEMYKDSIKWIREMIGFQHHGRKAKNKTTAKILIMDDRKTRERNKNKPYESMFHNGIVSLVNTEECSYDYNNIFDMTIYQFNKSLIQINGKKQACALLQGSMSGFIDTKGIPSKDFQWQYSEDKYKRISGRTLKESLAPNGGTLNIK